MVRIGDETAEVGATMLAEMADVPCFRVDAERNVVELSPAMERLSGFAAADVLGRSCLLLHRCEACLRSCGVFERGLVRDKELRLYRADGSTVDVLKSGLVLRGEHGAITGAVEIVRPLGPPRRDEARPSAEARTGPAEAAAIQAALEQARYRRADAARSLGMSRTTLWRKMKQHGL